MSYWIGVDVGGTNIVCGLLDDNGNIIHKKKSPTETHRGSDFVLQKIVTMAREILSEKKLSLQSVRAVGVGTPGLVDPIQGITLFAGNLGWQSIPVATHLESLIQVPVYVDNDVRMYVYGETMHGVGKGYKNVFGITLGTGIAAAVVTEGKLYYGGGYMAGEIGHIPMDGLTQVCACGGVGCLETVASATGIARQAREAILAGENSILKDWYEDVGSITASDVSKAYDLGDPVAIDVMHFTGRMLGRGLAYAVSLFSPDLIVIGGGAAMAGERILSPMKEELRRSVFKLYWDRLDIKIAQWIDDAGVIGSAMNAKAKLIGTSVFPN